MPLVVKVPEPQTFEPVPDSDYTLEFGQIEKKESKSSAHPYFETTMVVVGGKHDGRKIPRTRFSTHPNAIDKWLPHLLRATNGAVDVGEEVDLDVIMPAMEGQRVDAHVALKKGETYESLDPETGDPIEKEGNDYNDVLPWSIRAEGELVGTDE